MIFICIERDGSYSIIDNTGYSDVFNIVDWLRKSLDFYVLDVYYYFFAIIK